MSEQLHNLVSEVFKQICGGLKWSDAIDIVSTVVLAGVAILAPILLVRR